MTASKPKWNTANGVNARFGIADGKMESEIVSDEKTKIPIAIQSLEKPQDGVFEDASGTTYYTYHQGYEAAAKQVAAASI